MLQAALATPAEMSFLTVEAEHVRWGINADSVIEVVREKEWRGRQPLDPSRLAGLASRTGNVERYVVVIASGGQRLPILAAGELSQLAVEPDEVEPLPPELLGTTRWIMRRIAFLEDRALLILDPDALAGEQLR